MKKKTEKLSDEQRAEINRQSAIKDIQKRVETGRIPKNPTRLFNVGDQVQIGNHEKISVTEVLFDGLAYSVYYEYMGKSYGQPVLVKGSGVWAWVDVFPLTSWQKGEPLREVDDIRITYFNNDIDSLLHSVYYSGVDFNPDYQRDLVWTTEQKLALIDSVFNNIDIGKFTFIKHDYHREFFLEILDGKQRLSTLCEFYEDRFAWRGKKFSELCAVDARHFSGFPIIQGEVSEITEQQIYKLFVKMNTSGTQVSQEHLDRIRSLIS